MRDRDEGQHDPGVDRRAARDLQVTFEEGTWAAWFYDLLKPHVAKLVVCDPRRNASLQEGNRNDRVDARQLAELLRNNHLRSVYHGEHGLRSLKELVRSYLTITKDLSRVMSRVKAIYRRRAIPCARQQVYASRHRATWMGKIGEAGVRRRAEFYYQQLDALRRLRQEVRRELLAESKKHKAWKQLCQIPSIGPIRSAELLGILQTPHRFRTKRQLWTYSGVGIETRSSADHHAVSGQLERKKHVAIRGLNRNCNHDLKNMFKGAAIVALGQTRSVSRVLHSFAGQGHSAGDGASNPGQENRHDRSDRMEERSKLRRPTSETTNSLSVSECFRSIPGIFSGGGRGVCRDALY